ncbi:hypothetical protein Nepgr_021652 [Nepenthes gracilis]|uniref:Uncharacterized protein n=1 Tax=Nepenthes gracilis TaxID=150966 RepID=A0AAD3SZE3_NEPGR|nr:hypothetical protein Nepgr_021652 [Nepenthes gracilis]
MGPGCGGQHVKKFTPHSHFHPQILKFEIKRPRGRASPARGAWSASPVFSRRSARFPAFHLRLFLSAKTAPSDFWEREALASSLSNSIGFSFAYVSLGLRLQAGRSCYGRPPAGFLRRRQALPSICARTYRRPGANHGAATSPRALNQQRQPSCKIVTEPFGIQSNQRESLLMNEKSRSANCIVATKTSSSQ